MNRYSIILKSMLVASVAVVGASAAMAQGFRGYRQYEQQNARAVMEDMDNADANKDGMVSRTEFLKDLDHKNRVLFEKMDTNGDGMLDRGELKAAMAKDSDTKNSDTEDSAGQ